MSPDRGWDSIAWAEGSPHLLRNGAEVRVDLSRATLATETVVFLHHRTAETPVASGAAVAPARFVSMPSIAYRLARVAAGDGVATVSVGAPCGIDYAAGHALMRGAGGVLLDVAGQEVTYSPDGMSHVRRCIGGAPEAARESAARSWPRSSRKEPSRTTVALSWPRTVEDGTLDRAKGCLFGQVIGDNLGGGWLSFRMRRQSHTAIRAVFATSTTGATGTFSRARRRTTASSHSPSPEPFSEHAATTGRQSPQPMGIGTHPAPLIVAGRLNRPSTRQQMPTQVARQASRHRRPMLVARPTARSCASRP